MVEEHEEEEKKDSLESEEVHKDVATIVKEEGGRMNVNGIEGDMNARF